MAWLQLTFESNRESANTLSELLEKFGAVSVSLSASSNELLFGQGSSKSEDLWEQTRVTALLHEDTDLDTLIVVARNRVGADQIRQHQIELIEDRDWVSEYQQTHGPRIFGDQLCICPGWCTPPDHIPNILMLDPGLAFGTGTHDTTGMCLDWLVDHDVCGKQVIDYGCGSGVLALAALKLGAAHAWAVDIDAQALEATRANADRNQLSDQITIMHPDAIELPVVDMLLANVLLNPLKILATKFAGLVSADGVVVISGILATQAEECLAAYQSWFNMQTPVFRREWALLEGTRK
ncbi:MAG: ribosomal protein L11 methyltransferase [Gammaproteobacteria bacterium RIFCSPLOWO2_02_FULL_47_50]|nr:MAG: ribosomal protein L11 methyltransferase [Gammaproteobacteria bacterium RIFCSPLOWO2_01_FULL_47_190]OGT77222.1 MAG: ribosomal protein L11 methyltransferase [Gammaproteobacteria bacterium RIFCSPLOWO2_12_47_11]OGT78444.1 MAG: ribosomal protein L11 methyltransferase [Gammaproteobacteria bacterium RIFCSPLOWO2_02_FULL_47_50]OGT87681.1 MAG: ribosomal protein L11 methyltransferase [Gammaproteobacteria bacterium RIFCSPLOWO2_12_FULL_47_76]